MALSLGGLPLRSLVPVPALPRRSPSGQVVLVTGASSGIGEATALEAARLRHHVVLVARRREVLEKVAARCEEAGAASTLVLPCDVSDDEEVAALLALVAERHQRLDAVLHCAGQVSYGRTEDTRAADFDQVVRVNLSGSANIARHAIRVMRRQERGTLVLVGSLLGQIAVPEMTPYVVSKWAVRALARQLHVENIDLPELHVCHVVPGSVDTPIYDNALDDAGGVNEPPPPTITPERVARVVLSQLVWPRPETQTALLNYGIRAGFDLAPWAWDRAVGPAFRVASRKN